MWCIDGNPGGWVHQPSSKHPSRLAVRSVREADCECTDNRPYRKTIRSLRVGTRNFWQIENF